MKKVILLIAVCSLIFSGCSVKELNEKMVVIAMGVDFQDNNYIATVTYINTQSADGKEKYQTKSGTASTIAQAVNQISCENGLEVLYSHITSVVLGKSVCEKGITDTLAFFAGYYQCRAAAEVFVSETKAEDILKAKNFNPDMLITLADNDNITGLNYTFPLYKFYGDILCNGVSAYTSLISKTEKGEIQYKGCAVFDGDKIAYTLNGNQTFGLCLLNGRTDISSDAVSVDGKNRSFTIRNCKTEKKVSVKNGVMNCEIHLTAVIVPYEYTENKQVLLSYAEKSIRNTLNDVLKKCLQNGNDIFNFSRQLRLQDKKTYYQIDKWKNFLKNTSFLVVCDIYIK